MKLWAVVTQAMGVVGSLFLLCTMEYCKAPRVVSKAKTLKAESSFSYKLGTSFSIKGIKFGRDGVIRAQRGKKIFKVQRRF